MTRFAIGVVVVTVMAILGACLMLAVTGIVNAVAVLLGSVGA